MRILIVSNLYPPLHLGGYETRCAEVVDALRGRGHSVHVLTSRFGMADAADAPERDGDISRELHVAQGPPYLPEALRPLLRTAARDRGCAAALVDAFQPDVIDLWGMDGISRTLVQQLIDGEVPVHFMVEDAWPCESWRHDALSSVAQAARDLELSIPRCVQALCSDGLRPADFHSAPVTFVSQALREHCEHRGFAARRTGVRLAGLDLAPFHAGDPAKGPPFEVVAIGQLTAPRGFEDLISAAARVASQFDGPARQLVMRSRSFTVPWIRLRIIGGGSSAYQARLAELANAAQSAQLRIEFLGALSPERVRAALAGAHLFVHPSRLPEGLPRVLVEALAAGVPVVASDSGGQRDVLQGGRWGRLFPAGDSAALAHAMTDSLRRWLVDAPGVRTAAAAARTYALHTFDFQRYVGTHVAALAAVAAQRESGRTSSLGNLRAESQEITGCDDELVAFEQQFASAASAALDATDELETESLFRVAVAMKRCREIELSAALFERLLERGDAASTRRATFHLGELAMVHGEWTAADGWLRRCLDAASDHRKADYDLEHVRARCLPAHLSDLLPLRESAARPHHATATTVSTH